MLEDTKEDEEAKTGLVFIKQEIKNSCGPIACLHSILNVNKYMESAGFTEGSWLDRF